MLPAGRRDRLGRCRLGRRRQHRPDRRGRARRAADRPRAGQHRAHRRDLAGRRAARPQRARTSPWREARSRAIATSSSASRRACRTASPAPNDLEALRRAQEAAAPFGLPVMIHVGQNYSPMRAILPLLKRGDIVTHMYAPAPNGILDDKGRLFPDVLAARRRGVMFDFGNGVARPFRLGDGGEARPSRVSGPIPSRPTGTRMSRTTGVVDFPNVMSKFLMFGMPLSADDRAARPSMRRACSRRSTTAARSTSARPPTWRSWSCATARSSSSTTTRARAPASSACFRSHPCSPARRRRRGRSLAQAKDRGP